MLFVFVSWFDPSLLLALFSASSSSAAQRCMHLLRSSQRLATRFVRSCSFVCCSSLNVCQYCCSISLIHIYICYAPHAPTFSYVYTKIPTKHRLSWAGGEATNTFQLSGPDFFNFQLSNFWDVAFQLPGFPTCQLPNFPTFKHSNIPTFLGLTLESWKVRPGIVGMLERWKVGMLERWKVGMLES